MSKKPSRRSAELNEVLLGDQARLGPYTVQEVEEYESEALGPCYNIGYSYPGSQEITGCTGQAKELFNVAPQVGDELYLSVESTNRVNAIVLNGKVAMYLTPAESHYQVEEQLKLTEQRRLQRYFDEGGEARYQALPGVLKAEIDKLRADPERAAWEPRVVGTFEQAVALVAIVHDMPGLTKFAQTPLEERNAIFIPQVYDPGMKLTTHAASVLIKSLEDAEDAARALAALEQ